MTLSGTTMATTSRESWSAEIAAGVVIEPTNAPKPGSKVRHAIRPTGTTTNTTT